MRLSALLFLLGMQVAQASLLDSAQPVTLDQDEFSRIWQEVKSGAPAAAAASAADAWQSAMLQEDAELARVQLLLWLQAQNELLPLAADPQAYARAVSLHMKALAGQGAACAELAVAYRAGSLGGLQLPASEEKARWFEQRALTAENLPR